MKQFVGKIGALGVIASAAFAGVAAAQRGSGMGAGSMGAGMTGLGFGVLGGVTWPVGAYNNGSSTGWNGGVFADWMLPILPVGLRIEGDYHGFGNKDVFSRSNGTAQLSFSNQYSLWDVTANAKFSIPMAVSPVRPYIIAGVGGYNVRNSPTCTSSGSGTTGSGTSCTSYNAFSGSSSNWKFGWNAGAGIDIGHGPVNVFVEGRFNDILKAVYDPNCVSNAYLSGTTCDYQAARFVPVSIGLSWHM